MSGITSKRGDSSSQANIPSRVAAALPQPASGQAIENPASSAVDRLEIDVTYRQGDAVFLIAGRLCERALWHHKQWLLLQLPLQPDLHKRFGEPAENFEAVAKTMLHATRQRASEQRKQRRLVAERLLRYLRCVPASRNAIVSCSAVCEELTWLMRYPDPKSEDEVNNLVTQLRDAIAADEPIEYVLREIWSPHANTCVALLEDYILDRSIFRLGRWIEMALCPPDVANFMRRGSWGSGRWWRRRAADNRATAPDQDSQDVPVRQSKTRSKGSTAVNRSGDDQADEPAPLTAQAAERLLDAFCCHTVGVAELKPERDWIDDATPQLVQVPLVTPVFEHHVPGLEAAMAPVGSDQWIESLHQLAREFESTLGANEPQRNESPRATPLRHALGLTFDPQTNELTRDGLGARIQLRGSETITLVESLMQGGKVRGQRKVKKDQRAKDQNNLISTRVSRLNCKIEPLGVIAKLNGERYEFDELDKSACGVTPRD